MEDFIQKSAEDLAEIMNNAVAKTAIDIIEQTIWTSNIIAEENIQIYNEFKKSMESVPEEDKDLYKDHEPQYIKFNNITDEFSYSFRKLIENWYSLLHTILPNWLVKIKLYKMISEETYKINYTIPDIQIEKS